MDALLGIFEYEDELLSALEKLEDAGFERPVVFSPVPLEPALEKIYGARKSPIRRFSLAGAIIGGLSGFTLATACALVFILPTGGRPVITFPPFLVITYEMTILIGVLATLLGFHVVSGLPAWRDAPYREVFNVDRFGVQLAFADEAKRSLAERIIRDAGAERIETVQP